MDFEPHMHTHFRHPSADKHFDEGAPGINILEELDKIVPIKTFDSFPKVQGTYRSRSGRGGLVTVVMGLVIFLLILAQFTQAGYDLAHVDLRNSNDLGEYLFGDPTFSFEVDKTVERSGLQLNVDLTVAMPCQYLSIDLRDVLGDRLHLSDDFAKHGTVFKTDRATSAAIFGSVEVKRATANLHITTAGHGYSGIQHTQHEIMNLSHVIHEFSFGPYFPAIAQPLDMTYKAVESPFSVFQYFLSVVPTKYIDGRGRRILTNQYAVTDYERIIEHGRGIPGIFFRFDIESLNMTVEERTTSLYSLLIRLAGVIGGVWTTAAFGLRVLSRAEKELVKKDEDEPIIPHSLPSTPLSRSGLSTPALDGSGRPGMPRKSSSWLSRRTSNSMLM